MRTRTAVLAALLAVAGCSAEPAAAPLPTQATSAPTTSAPQPGRKLSEVWNDRLTYLDTSPCAGAGSGGAAYTSECNEIFTTVGKVADLVKADADRAAVPALSREAAAVGEAARHWTNSTCPHVQDATARLNCFNYFMKAIAGPGSMLRTMRDSGQ